jgi:ribosomal protein L3
VLDDENLILAKGGVPGSKNGIVTVRGAVKAKAAKS